MPESSAENEMLLGILALQNDFVSHEQFLMAFRAWAKDKSQSFSDLLVAQDAIGESERSLLVKLRDAHVDRHAGDAEQSLAALPAISDDIREEFLAESIRTNVVGNTNAAAGDQTLTLAVGQPTGAGRFRVLRPHRKGGLGEVFVALDIELDREVALKQIRSNRVIDNVQRDRFRREAEITGKLEHPGIVPVYGLGEDAAGQPYYAMRFIRGRSLRDAIDEFYSEKSNATQRNKEFRRLLGWFIDVCDAISYAHSRGVLHRDLKPANIMLGRFGETLVVDWGLAKVEGVADKQLKQAEEKPVKSRLSGQSSATIDGTVVGTPAYMSPEQAEGRLDLLSPRSDVYSLGATLHTIITGKRPVDGDVTDVIRNVREGTIPRPRESNPNVPQPLEAICLKAMSLDRSSRYMASIQSGAGPSQDTDFHVQSGWPATLAGKIAASPGPGGEIG